MTYTNHTTPLKSWPRGRTALVCLLLLPLLFACQSQPVKRVSLKQGMDYKLLLDAYGKPHDQSYIATTEQNRYSWELSDVRLEHSRSRRSTNVSSSGAVTTSSNPTSTVRRIYCNLTVFVNQQNKVVNWQAEGTGCRQILYHQI